VSTRKGARGDHRTKEGHLRYWKEKQVQSVLKMNSVRSRNGDQYENTFL